VRGWWWTPLAVSVSPAPPCRCIVCVATRHVVVRRCRELKEERAAVRRALTPLLQAEEDARFVRAVRFCGRHSRDRSAVGRCGSACGLPVGWAAPRWRVGAATCTPRVRHCAVDLLGARLRCAGSVPRGIAALPLLLSPLCCFSDILFAPCHTFAVLPSMPPCLSLPCPRLVLVPIPAVHSKPPMSSGRRN